MAIRKAQGYASLVLDVWVPDETRKDGRRKVLRSLGTLDRKKAVVRAAAILEELKAPQRDSEELTLSDLYRRVLAFKERDKAPNTLAAYRTAFESLFLSLPKTTPLSAVTVDLIDRWRTATRIKPSTMNEYAGKIAAAFRLAVRWKILAESPFQDIDPFEVPGTDEIKYLTESQVKDFKAVLETPKDWHLVGLCLYAGLRISEAIRVTSIDSHVRVEMKTKSKSHRLVPVSAQLAAILEQHPFEPIGLTRNKAYLRIRELGSRAGFKLHPHMLRHTFAAFHLSGGRSIETVADWLGHSSSATTRAVYRHLVPGTGDDEIDLSGPP